MTIDSVFKVNFSIAALACAGFLAFMVYEDRNGQIAITILLILLLLATRLSELRKLTFGASGIAAEMREVKAAIEEAKATVAQLHIVTELFARATLRGLYAEGRWGGSTLKAKREMRDLIEDSVRKLEMSETQIKSILNAGYEFEHFDHIRYILLPLEDGSL
jgi:hypothetical protein